MARRGSKNEHCNVAREIAKCGSRDSRAALVLWPAGRMLWPAGRIEKCPKCFKGPFPTLPAVGTKGFIEGGGQPREGKNFDLHPPPQVVSSARKGKKAERSSDEDAMVVAARQGL